MREVVLASTFAVACAFGVWTAPSAHAAMLTFGNPTQFYGGTNCADVNGASITPGNAVDARPCSGAQNEQFQWNGLAIIALGDQRCLDIFGGPIVAGAKVDSFTCTGNPNQQWYYYKGQVKTFVNNLCLDAGNGASGTQLIVNTCSGSTNQQWQIK
jgi:hypothetical protein